MNANTQQPREPRPEQRRKFPLGGKALIFESSAIISALLVSAFSYIGGALSILPWFLCGLWTVAAPIIGIIMGIISMCLKSRRTRLNTALSVISIVLPIIVIGTLLLLMSKRVIIIGFM